MFGLSIFLTQKFYRKITFWFNSLVKNASKINFKSPGEKTLRDNKILNSSNFVWKGRVALFRIIF